MRNEKLFEKLGNLLETSEKADKKHIKKLRKILLTLKENQKALRLDLHRAEEEHERRKILQEIEVLKLQRKKGVKVYKDLKSGHSKKTSESE